MRTRSILFVAALAAIAGTALIRGGTTDEAALVPPSPEPAAVRMPSLVAAPSLPPTDVLAVLASVEAASGAERDRLARDAHFTLVHALTDDPERTISALEDFLAAAPAAGSRARIALGALVAAGSPAMQAALLRLVDARAVDARFIRLVVPSLGFLAKPTAATEAALRALAADAAAPATRATADLALGVMASRLAAAEPARGAAIVDGYASRLASARTADERVAALDVLGNAGTPAAAAAIATQLHAGDAKVRGRAVESLRRVPTAEAEATLRGAIDDADEHVRASAAWSLSYRTPSPETMRALLARLGREPSDQVAIAILDAVWVGRGDNTGVAAAVREVAGGHASQKVRAHARALLEGAG